MAETDATFISNETDVENFRLRWLGRKQGLLNEVSSRWLKAAPPEAKKAVGERFKALKTTVESERLAQPSESSGEWESEPTPP